MKLIHSATAREIVIALDLRYDLQSAGLLLDTYGNYEDLSDEEIECRERENDRRVELFEAAYLKTLAQVTEEQHLTVYVGAASEATDTPRGKRDDDSWESYVWQDAHDRTPAESLWADSAVTA